MNCCRNEKIVSLGNPTCYSTFGDIRKVVFVDKNLVNNVANFTATSFGHATNSFTLYEPSLATLVATHDAVVTEVVEDLSIEKSEDTFKTYPNGRRIRIRKGNYTVSFALPLQIAQTLQGFNQMYCKKMGVYFINAEDKVIGYEHAVGNNLYLAPIPLFDKSVSSAFLFQSGDEPEKMTVNFVLEQFAVENLRMLDYDTVTAVTPVYVAYNNNYNGNTESVEFNTTTNTITTVLSFSNNVHYEAYVSPDFIGTAPFNIFIRDVATNALITVSCTAVAYNSTTKELTLTCASLPLTIGNQYRLERIAGMLIPLGQYIYNDLVYKIDTTTATAQ